MDNRIINWSGVIKGLVFIISFLIIYYSKSVRNGTIFKDISDGSLGLVIILLTYIFVPNIKFPNHRKILYAIAFYFLLITSHFFSWLWYIVGQTSVWELNQAEDAYKVIIATAISLFIAIVIRLISLDLNINNRKESSI